MVWSLASSFPSSHFLDWRPMLAPVGLKFVLCNISTSLCLINRKGVRFSPKRNGNWNLMWEHASSETPGRPELLKALFLEDLYVPSLFHHVLSQLTGLGLISSMGEDFPWNFVRYPLSQLLFELPTMNRYPGDQPNPTWPKWTCSDVWCFERNLRRVSGILNMSSLFFSVPVFCQ